MAISVNHFIVGTGLRVPVGFDAGAADVDAAVTTVVEDWGPLLGVLPLLPIRERSWVMRLLITENRSVEAEGPEPGAGPVYKIQSGNHSLVETPAHTHRIPALRHATLTVNHRSLRSNRRSIRHGCKQSQNIRRHHVVRK